MASWGFPSHVQPPQPFTPPQGGQIAEGTITYTQAVDPSGRVVYHQFRAVPATYTTPNGPIHGMQWIPVDATNVLPAGAIPAGKEFTDSWYNSQRDLEKWERDEDKRRRKEEKEAAKRVRGQDGRKPREHDLAKAREMDAELAKGRERRRSFNAGAGGYPSPGMGPGGFAHPPGSTGAGPYDRDSKYADVEGRFANMGVDDRYAGPHERERKSSFNAGGSGGIGRPRKTSFNVPGGAGHSPGPTYATTPYHAPHNAPHIPGRASPNPYSAAGGHAGPHPSGRASPNPYPHGSGVNPGNPYPGPHASGRISPHPYPHGPNVNPYPGPHASGRVSPNPYPHGAGVNPSNPYPGPHASGRASPNPYPSAGGGHHANPYPSPHMTTRASPSAFNTPITSGGYIPPSPNMAGGPLSYGAPNPVYPKNHILEGQSAQGALVGGGGYHPGSGMPYPSPVGPMGGHPPGMGYPTSPGQQFDSPPSFRKPVNAAHSYAPFENLKIQDMDAFLEHIPRMPLVLQPHDVGHDDWIRCMEDISRAWASAHSGQPGRQSRPSTAVRDIVDAWNINFFLPRGVEVVLYKGRERRSGNKYGHVDTWLPSYEDDELSSESSLSSGSNSSAEERELAQQYGAYGRGSHAQTAEIVEARRRRAARKMEKKRRQKEKKHRKKERERSKTYSLYLTNVPHAHDGARGPHGAHPGAAISRPHSRGGGAMPQTSTW